MYPNGDIVIKERMVQKFPAVSTPYIIETNKRIAEALEAHVMMRY